MTTTTTTSPTTFWAEIPRDFVMVEGADAMRYLQSQVAQDLSGLAVGDAVASLVLEPQGRVAALVRILRSGDHAFVLDLDAGCAEALITRLSRFMIRVDARITTIAWRCIAVRGPDAGTLAGQVVGGVVVPAWWGDGTAVDVIGPGPVPPTGSPAGALDEVEAARVAAGWPAMGSEITENSLPAELGVVGVAVSFTKGCYPGQELVERMDSRSASAPRSLRRLTVPEGARPGDPVIVEGAEVGRFTSVAPPWALALVRRGVAAGDPIGEGP